MSSLDFEAAEQAAREQAEGVVDYCNPMREPYGDWEKATESQKKIWRYYEEHRGTGPVLAMIGAKGSGKSFCGAALAMSLAQEYPESLGCLIANSDKQAKDTARKLLMHHAKSTGYSIEFFTVKKVRGQPFNNLYVVDLDGQGVSEGQCSYILIRSFDTVELLEGVELDWVWSEETQDASRKDFVQAVSRAARSTVGDGTIFVAGMPDDDFHWQYSLIPSMIENRKSPDHPDGGNGLLLEPSLFENRHNVQPGYIDHLKTIYDEKQVRRYVHGERMSLNTSRVVHSYSAGQHRKGAMSSLLCEYEPYSRLIVSFDFNVSPMSVSVWQEKMWNDKWARMEGEEPTEDWPGPNREVLAQVDEFEVWQGGTEAVCRQIASKYEGHPGGMHVIGDATGNRSDTRSSRTDWDIIREILGSFPQSTVLPGLKSTSNLSKGEIRYSNPARRDTINILNRLLRDGKGKAHMCFLPETDLESGGAAASVQSMERKEDGRLDESADRSEDRSVARTHFFDTVRYVAYWYAGGEAADAAEHFNQTMSSLGAGGPSASGDAYNWAEQDSTDRELFGDDDELFAGEAGGSTFGGGGRSAGFGW